MTVSDRVLPVIATPPMARGRLRFGWTWRVLLFFLLGLFPAILLVGALNTAPRERALGWSAFVIVSALASAAGFLFLRARWLVDEDGIQPHSLLVFRKLPHVPWSAVTEIAIGQQASLQGIFVRSRIGRPIFLSLGLDGLDAFAYFALAHAPGTIASPTLRRSLEARASALRPFSTMIVTPEIADPAESARQRVRDNPFYVLAVSREASRAEVERAGQKLLALLGVGASAARTYATPLGAAERTADKVRGALAELRVPEKRLAYELETRAEIATEARDDDPTRPWTGALAAVGWRRR